MLKNGKILIAISAILSYSFSSQFFKATAMKPAMKKEINVNEYKSEINKIYNSNIDRIYKIEKYIEDKKTKKLKMFSSCHDEIIYYFIMFENINPNEIESIAEVTGSNSYYKKQGLDIAYIENLIYTIEKKQQARNDMNPLRLNDIKKPIDYMRTIIKTLKTQYEENYLEYEKDFYEKINKGILYIEENNLYNKEIKNLVELYKYIHLKLHNNIIDNITFNLDCLNNILEETEHYVSYCKEDEKIYENYQYHPSRYPGRKNNNILDNILVKFKNNVVKILRNTLPPTNNENLSNFFKQQNNKSKKNEIDFEEIKKLFKTDSKILKEKNFEDKNFEKEKDIFDGVKFLKSDIEKIASINKNIKENLEYLILLNEIIFNNIKNEIFKKGTENNINNIKNNDLNLNNKNIKEISKIIKKLFKTNNEILEEKNFEDKNFEKEKDIFDGIKFLKSDIEKITSTNKNIKKNLEYLILLNEIIFKKGTENNIINNIENNKNKKFLSILNNIIFNNINNEFLKKETENNINNIENDDLNLNNENTEEISEKIKAMLKSEKKNEISKAKTLKEKFGTEIFNDLAENAKRETIDDEYYIINKYYEQEDGSYSKENKSGEPGHGKCQLIITTPSYKSNSTTSSFL